MGGAVFGLLAVLYVELFQFWQIVDKAWLELFKLTGFIIFLLLLGTLPYIDNFAQIGEKAVHVMKFLCGLHYIVVFVW